MNETNSERIAGTGVLMMTLYGMTIFVLTANAGGKKKEVNKSFAEKESIPCKRG